MMKFRKLMNSIDFYRKLEFIAGMIVALDYNMVMSYVIANPRVVEEYLIYNKDIRQKFYIIFNLTNGKTNYFIKRLLKTNPNYIGQVVRKCYHKSEATSATEHPNMDEVDTDANDYYSIEKKYNE